MGVGVCQAERTHQNRPKRLTLKSGRKDPGRNDLAETTHGQNDSCLKRPTAETTQNHRLLTLVLITTDNRYQMMMAGVHSPLLLSFIERINVIASKQYLYKYSLSSHCLLFLQSLFHQPFSIWILINRYFGCQ